MDNKVITAVYADEIGLVLQSGIAMICNSNVDGAYIKAVSGDTWKQKQISIYDLRNVTGNCTLFVNVRRTAALTNTYGVKAFDEISFCGEMAYFTDMFSGEDKQIMLHDLKYISTDIS